jgi:putative hemolysin
MLDMKKYLILIALMFLVILFLINPFENYSGDNKEPVEDAGIEKTSEKEGNADMPNPASKYCEENGGTLDIITNKDGAQFGMCVFEDYSCEEWTYLNGECAVDEDSEKIRQALVAKGLDLTGMEVIIHKHLGKYISGGVVPVSRLGGGGYVFAVKDEGGDIKIVADGNGAIMCSMLEEYSDYPAYLIPECIDEDGKQIIR